MNNIPIKRRDYTTSFREHFIQMEILKEIVQISGAIPLEIFYKEGCIMRPCRLFIIMNLSHTAASSYCNTWMITACFVVRTYYTIRACDKHIPSFLLR